MATAVAGMVLLPFASTAQRVTLSECLRLYEPNTPLILVYDCWQGSLGGTRFPLALQHTGHVRLEYGGAITFSGRGGGFESRLTVAAFSREYVCFMPPRWTWGALHLRSAEMSFSDPAVQATCGDQTTGMVTKSYWPPYVLGLGHDRYPRR
ncbi:MAG: hypothetical protein EXR52_07685 [Dehalococcoidia bacterium]|nr:hypothetical protein [Dehalococcoidia bacterium]